MRNQSAGGNQQTVPPAVPSRKNWRRPLMVRQPKSVAVPSTEQVEAEGTVTSVTTALKNVHGVQKITVERQSAENTNVYNIEHESGIDIRKGVFNAMVNNKSVILTMNEGGMSLEEAYLKLTSKPVPKGGKK